MKKRLRHLPAGLAASAVLLLLGLVLGAVFRGPVGAFGAAAGVLLVAASYSGSSLIIAWVDLKNRAILLPVALVTYAVKFTVIGFVLAGLAAAHWGGLVPLGLAVMVTALVWVVAQAVWTWRARILYVEIDPPS